MRKRPNIPWATALHARPVTQQHTLGADAAEDPLPELRFELPPFPSRLIFVRTGPPRPRGSTPVPATTGNDAEKSEAPTIAPQLTSQESTVAEQQTNQSLRIAENNLQSARGKNLNATQTDLVSKIRGFIKDAREAANIFILSETEKSSFDLYRDIDSHLRSFGFDFRRILRMTSLLLGAVGYKMTA